MMMMIQSHFYTSCLAQCLFNNEIIVHNNIIWSLEANMEMWNLFMEKILPETYKQASFTQPVLAAWLDLG